MAAERNTFLERFGIRRVDGEESWLGRLVLHMQRSNEYHISDIQDELRGMAQQARELDVISTLCHAFHGITRCANGIRSELSRMVQLYQKNRYRIPLPLREQLRIKFDYVRHIISTCVTQEREARSHLRNLQPSLAVLTLPQSEFEALIEAFPPYSTNAEIIGRLADTVESLREVASESSIIHRAARIRHQATSTWQLDENAAPHDDGLIADYSRLCREMQSHVALQSNALAEIQAELDAARGLPLVMHTASGTILMSDLTDVLSAFTSLQEELETISILQTELRESLDEASQELLSAVLPPPPTRIRA
ncbi:hypothetical protein VTO73DRAFT_14440 [Trametes versicolor]